MLETDSPKWHIVYIKPKKEKLVKVQLERIGIETFYPMVRVKRSRELVVEPMFPLYMFARFSVAKDFLNVNYARGVRRVVRFGSLVPAVGEDFIDFLRKVDGSIIADRKVEFEEGDLVRVKEGPFRNFIGKVLEFKRGEERVILLLKAVNSPKVEIPVEYVEVISERKYG